MRKISRRNFLLASGAVTISAALSACGGSSSSTGAASSAAASSAASAAPAAQGKVLNIWCWNDEFQGRFNNYYPEVASIAEDKSTTTLKDGTVVKWTINANENNNYQNKLDEALLNQDSAADDDKVDIFLIEADYALKYVDSDYALDVKADIGLTDADLAGQYQYTKDIVSVDGSQRGTTWQATPGLFAYRRSIAKEVLGTDDPTEVQSHLSDWDKFNEVAAQAYAKGYKMLSGFDDAYRTFSNNVSAPWVTGTTVTVDENLMKWVDQTKEYTDKGYSDLEAQKVGGTIVKRPGFSEHNCGLAMDVGGSGDYTLEQTFANTAAYTWLMEHCADYGFILRFPEGKEDITGVIYEPWHYRYVGVEAARYIMDNDLCLEEYLAQVKK